MRGKVFFFTGVSFCAIFFLEPSGNLLLEPSGSSWVPPDGSIFVFAIGSPPHVRGKGSLECSFRPVPGITPAYAGKRYDFYSICYRRWDHPRVCGEKGICKKCRSLFLGSPPRMRGKGNLYLLDGVLDGITPAYAGKSSGHPPAPGRTRDHPRVCGEKSRPLSRWVYALGSPPRMQGKGPLPRDALPALGITPAYAGKRRRMPRPPRKA